MKVLIIGGGFGGLASITGLREKLDASSNVEIILVEPKAYFEVAFAAYRSPFDENTANNSLFDLAPFCEKNRVVHKQTVVTKLSSTQATLLANGETIEFDVCVVATGVGTPWAGLGRGPPQAGKGRTISHVRIYRFLRPACLLLDPCSTPHG
jgi:NADH dehydrogenase FAD-containing subunit